MAYFFFPFFFFPAKASSSSESTTGAPDLKGDLAATNFEGSVLGCIDEFEVKFPMFPAELDEICLFVDSIL